MHLALRLLNENLVALNKAFAILTAIGDVLSTFTIERWGNVVQGLTSFHRGIRASQLASEFYASQRAVRPRLASDPYAKDYLRQAICNGENGENGVQKQWRGGVQEHGEERVLPG